MYVYTMSRNPPESGFSKFHYSRPTGSRLPPALGVFIQVHSSRITWPRRVVILLTIQGDVAKPHSCTFTNPGTRASLLIPDGVAGWGGGADPPSAFPLSHPGSP